MDDKERTFVPWITVHKILEIRDSVRRPSLAERRNQYIGQLAEDELSDLVSKELFG